MNNAIKLLELRQNLAQSTELYSLSLDGGGVGRGWGNWRKRLFRRMPPPPLPSPPPPGGRGQQPDLSLVLESFAAPARGARRVQGFTLLELLVAMAIFAFIGIMAYGGLAAMIKSSEGSREAREQLAEVQRGLRIVDDDMSMLINRPVRDGLGSQQLALQTGRDGSTVLEFTRTVRVREGFAPSPFSRVRYRWQEGVLWRDEWNPPDAAQLEPDQVVRLWRGVSGIELRFLEDGKESQSWPPPAENMSLPQALSMQLRFEDGRAITQVMLLPDAGVGDVMNAESSGQTPASEGDGQTTPTANAEQDRS